MTQRPRPVVGYLIAIGSALAVALLSYALSPLLGNTANFVMFTVPVVLAGWYNGLRPALVATLAGALLAAYLVPPELQVAIESPRDILGIAVFTACGIIIGALCESMHAARERLRRGQVALHHEAALREEAQRRNLDSMEQMSDALYVIDEQQRFAYLNPAARQLFTSQGMDPAAVVGKVLWDLFPDVVGTVVHSEIGRVLKERIPAAFEFHYPRWDRWFGVRIYPAPDRSVAVHLSDATDLHTLRAEVQASEAQAHENLRKLQVLYDTAPIGLCELDLELRYVRINNALARMNGYPAAAHIGRTVREMLPEYGARYEREFREVLATGIPVFERQIEGYTASDPGVLHWWLESWYPITNSDGVVEGLSVVAQDVSALKRAQSSLQQREAQLRLAVEAANHSAYEWDIPSGIVTRLGEVPHSAPLGARYTFEELVETVHPEDRASMLARIEATLRGETDVYISEHRSNENPERDWCWVRVRGRLIRAAEGTPAIMIGVSMDITEHKRLEEALREADRRKDDFLATLAHELRNPLAPIRNALHLIKATPPVDPRMAQGRDVIDRQVSQMARLLDDLLDVSRITRGTLELRHELVSLRQVIDRAMETSHPLIANSGHAVQLVFPEDEALLVDADVIRLAQVFSNLLNNAAKYMDNGGRITLRAQRQGSDVLVSVADTGMGIDAEHLASIFEMFTRGAPAAHRSRDGLGIGLSLARSIVELHGGTLEARSAGLGHGSEFEVRLPLHVTLAAPAPSPVEDPVLATTAPWRLVIADDLKDSADSLADLLRLHGHDVTTAYDGEQAVAAVERVRPEAVLLDIGMPKLDGYEACRRIRAEPWGADLLIVALTGWGQSVDRDRTKAAGFTRHLVKPVDFVTLLNVLNELRREALGVRR